MEHVEAAHVWDVLRDIKELTKRAVFFQIATGPASKVLPDGRNAHITQEPSNYWLGTIMSAGFDIKSFMLVQGGFILVAAPFEGTVSPAAEL